MLRKIIFLVVVAIFTTSCSKSFYKSNNYKMIIPESEYKELNEGLYAKLTTSKGEMLVNLHHEESPLTVANFIGLAEGTKENNVKESGEPFYDGTIFHRIIKDFMIQGGDPKGTGTGDPGYKFLDEKNDLKHDKKGMLSMANSGPNTNGSQFFITEIPTPWLDGKHTIFGEVINGLDVVDSLANSKTGGGDKPNPKVVLEKVEIIRKGASFENYNGGLSFDKIKTEVEEKAKAAELAAKAKLEKLLNEMEVTASGLKYVITNKTDGKAPKSGDNVEVHYTGKLENGKVFDSSVERGTPLPFAVDTGRVIKGWDEGIMLLKEGEKAVLWIPSNLAYGARGAGGVIPPNANLIFEVELVKINQ